MTLMARADLLEEFIGKLMERQNLIHSFYRDRVTHPQTGEGKIIWRPTKDILRQKYTTMQATLVGVALDVFCDEYYDKRYFDIDEEVWQEFRKGKTPGEILVPWLNTFKESTITSRVIIHHFMPLTSEES